MRILIVDNNVELCLALQDYFDTQHDLEVAGLAYDGEQALSKIKELQPDVVLLDITMPYLDGLGVIERLQTLSLQRKPKVFVITAFGTDNLLARLMALGADYFLVKPFKLEILAQRLREFAQSSKEMIASETASALESRLTTDQKVTQLLHSAAPLQGIFVFEGSRIDVHRRWLLCRRSDQGDIPHSSSEVSYHSKRGRGCYPQCHCGRLGTWEYFVHTPAL